MKEINKKIITQKALEMFRKRGYKNVTVDEICVACGITKPTFYSYVPAKEELILDVYDNIIDHLLDNIADIEKISSPYEQLICVFSKLINETADFGADLLTQLFVANFKKDRHSFAFRSQLTKLALSLIEKAKEKGEITNPADAENLYYTLGHLFTGYASIWCITQGQEDQKETFFKSMNTLLIPSSAELAQCYKKYI